MKIGQTNTSRLKSNIKEKSFQIISNCKPINWFNEAILRPMSNTRKKRNYGCILISGADARNGTFGSVVYSNESSTSYRQTTFQLQCITCNLDQSNFLITIPESWYLDSLSRSGTWFNSTFLRSFLQLCYHDEHSTNPGLEYKLVHCIFPNQPIDSQMSTYLLPNDINY